jgi:hypothetical protein
MGMGQSATRTTDSLFGDLLGINTQIGSTQKMLNFNPMMPQQTNVVQPIDLSSLFKQQTNNRRQGMLTNAQPKTRRFPY